MPMNAMQAVELSFVDWTEKNESRRQTETWKRLQMLRDDFESEALNELKKYVSVETYEDLKETINCTVNVFATVIEEISMVYYESPTRIFKSDKDNDPLIPLIEEDYKRMRINQKFKTINLYINALNDCLGKVVFRKEKIELDIITGNIVSIVQDDVDLTLPAIIGVRKIFADSISGGNRDHWEIWSTEEHFKLDENSSRESVNSEDVNPYEKLPFIFGHDRLRDSGFWNQTGGSDLYKCTLKLAVFLTLLDFNFTYHNFKQTAIRAEFVEEGIGRKPDHVIHLTGQDDEAHVLDYSMNLTELYKGLREYASLVTQRYGVDWNALLESVTEESGRAKIIKNSRLQRMLKNQVEIFKDLEADFFELYQMFSRLHYKNRNIDHISMEVQFHQMEYKDEKTELDVMEKEIEMNLTDLVTAYMKRNRGVKSEKQAREMVEKIIKTNNEMAAKVDKPLSSLFKDEDKHEEYE